MISCADWFSLLAMFHQLGGRSQNSSRKLMEEDYKLGLSNWLAYITDEEIDFYFFYFFLLCHGRDGGGS